MKEKVQLPMHMALKAALALKDDENVEQDYEVIHEDRYCFIRVAEDEDGIETEIGYYEDSCKFSAPTPSFDHFVDVEGLRFTAYQGYDEIGKWKLESDEYFIPDDAMKIFTELIEEIHDGPNDPYDIAYYPDSDYEWEWEEAVNEIEDKLSYDKYIYTDEYGLFPLTTDVETFMKKHYPDYFVEYEDDEDDEDDDEDYEPTSWEDEVEYKVLTKHEAAEYLAEVYAERP